MEKRLVDLVFIVPFRNEAKIPNPYPHSLSRQEIGDYRAEIMLIDGMSTDNSLKVVENYFQKAEVKNLEFSIKTNPEIKTPSAFNIGITQSNSPIIGFGGAHTNYPSNYFHTAIELLQSTDAEVVGGGPDE